MFDKAYNVEKDLKVLREQLRKIEDIGEYLSDPRWRTVRAVFTTFIGKQAQNMLELCDKPGKNEIEIVSTRKAAKWLSSILKSFDDEIGRGNRIRKEINQKEQAIEKAEKPEPVV